MCRPDLSCGVGVEYPLATDTIVSEPPVSSRWPLIRAGLKLGVGVLMGQRSRGHGLVIPAPTSDVDATSTATKPQAKTVKSVALSYLALTKPRVIELLLVATIPTMLLADRAPDWQGAVFGRIDLPLILATLFGGWLGAASANTLNCVVDADIDKMMKRTERRPLALDSVSQRGALVFGVVLGVASFSWLWWQANLLAGSLVVATILFYVFVYTLGLKRRTSQNVVWGGAAGCMPTLVGWAAVTNSIAWPAVALFLVIFFWTPPHTWALAMRYREDYRAAGVPMLPVVASDEHVTMQIMWYTVATLLASFALIPATGVIYAAVVVVSGGWFLLKALQLYRGVRNGATIEPLKLFLQSNSYLSLVFCGLAIDSVLAYPTTGERILNLFG